MSLLGTPKGILNRNDTCGSHRTSDMWHLLLPSWSQLGSSHSWVSFLLLPFHFQTHFTRSEKTFQVQTSLNTSELLQFTPSSSATASSCKEKESSLCSGRHPDLELQGQHIHPAPETRTMLNTLILPLLREFSRGNHTLQLPSQGRSYHTSLSWQCCTHRKVSGEEDVFCHCLFLCPALTRCWFCPNIFFFYTEEGLFPPLQDPFSSTKPRLGNKDCWEAAWSSTEERAVMDV